MKEKAFPKNQKKMKNGVEQVGHTLHSNTFTGAACGGRFDFGFDGNDDRCDDVRSLTELLRLNRG